MQSPVYRVLAIPKNRSMNGSMLPEMPAFSSEEEAKMCAKDMAEKYSDLSFTVMRG